jgi:uncharacterized protein (DUF1499 family)
MRILFVVGMANLLLLAGCAGPMHDLGVDNGELAPCPETPNCVSSQAADEKHTIQPIRFNGTLPEARARLLQILDSMKRTTIVTAQDHYIRAEVSSAVFRFVDDVEFFLPDDPNGEKVIHVRSASRKGNSDFGVNRKRVEWIRSRFSE